MKRIGNFFLAGAIAVALLGSVAMTALATELPFDLSPEQMSRTARSVSDPNVSFPVPMYDDNSDGFVDRITWLGVTATWNGNAYVGEGVVVNAQHADPGAGWDWDALVFTSNGPETYNMLDGL